MILITVMVIATVVIAAFSFLVWVLSEDRQEEALIFEMTDINEGIIAYDMDYSGSDASQLRGAIDREGNYDRRVSSGEVREYEERIEDMVNDVFMPAYRIDFKQGLASQCDISYQGADGDVESEEAIREKMVLRINWTFLDLTKSWYVTEIWTSYVHDEMFKYIAPPGFKIISSGGLDNEHYDDDRDTVYGEVKEDEVYITTSRIEGSGLGDYEPNDHTSTASPASDGAVIEGELVDTGDIEDFYYIVLDSGDEVEITLDGPDNADFDVFLYRYFPTVLKSGTSDDSDEFLYHQAESAGIYFISITPNADNGSYTLSVEVH